MRGVALDDRDKVGHLVVPLLEEDVDVGPRLRDVVLQAHERVVDDDGRADEDGDRSDREDDGERRGADRHGLLQGPIGAHKTLRSIP